MRDMIETTRRGRVGWRHGRGLIAIACGLLLGAVGSSAAAQQPPKPIVLSLVKLRLDATGNPSDGNGRLSLKTLLDDNDTVGIPGEDLATRALADQVTLTLTDGVAFNAEVALTGCRSTSGTPLNLVKITCRSGDRNVRARFVPTRQGPLVYNMRVSARGLPASVTGTVPPSGPVTVTVHQTPTIDRADVITNCQARAATTLICRER